MKTYKVKAKYAGDSVSFEVESEDMADALKKARVEARRIFLDASGMEHLIEIPTVDVKTTK